MSTPIENLLVVQERDRKILRLAREAEDIPVRKQHLQARLDELRNSIEEARTSIRDNELEVKELEGQIQLQKDKQAKYKVQQNEAKTNIEYQTLTREIAGVGRKVGQLEDREIELMESVEPYREKIAQLEAKLKEDESLLAEDLEAMDQRASNLGEQLAKLKADRDEKAQQVDPSWMSRYERILKNRGDAALVPVENNSTCGGCHMHIPPQTGHNARTGEKMTSCDYCGRLLYVPR